MRILCRLGAAAQEVDEAAVQTGSSRTSRLISGVLTQARPVMNRLRYQSENTGPARGAGNRDGGNRDGFYVLVGASYSIIRPCSEPSLRPVGTNRGVGLLRGGWVTS